MRKRSPLPGRLRSARLRAGLRQKELGIRAGIDEFSASARINQYEKGKHTPDYQTMERLADVLGVPVPFFYTRDNSLADLILAWGVLSPTDRKRLLKNPGFLILRPSGTVGPVKGGARTGARET